MTEFIFDETMSEADLLAFKVRPGDVIHLTGFLDTPRNSRFDLSNAGWNGTRDRPVTILGHDAVITATNLKVMGGWTRKYNPTLHYTRNEIANLAWMVEGENFISKATGKPEDSVEEWANGEALWFDDNAGTFYYKPVAGIDANEQTLNWSSGRTAIKISGKRHIHLEGMDVSNCHTVGGNILIGSSTGISVGDSDSYLGSISIFSGKDISLRNSRLHDYGLPLMMQNPAGTFENIVIEGNYIYECDRYNRIGVVADYQAISFRGNVKNMVIKNNYIDAPVRDGIALYQHRVNKWDGVEVSRNYVADANDMIRRIHSGGILLGGDDRKGTMEPKDYIHVHHNVVRGSVGYGLRIKEYPASSPAARMRVHDNYSFDNGRPDQTPMAVKPDANNYSETAENLMTSITLNTPYRSMLRTQG